MITYSQSRRIEPYRRAITNLYAEHNLQTHEEVGVYVFLVAQTRPSYIYINPSFSAAYDLLSQPLGRILNEQRLPLVIDATTRLNNRREFWMGLKGITQNNPSREEILHAYAAIVATFDHYLNGQLTV